MPEVLLAAAGRRRSPATLSAFHAGRPPRDKGMRYPGDPPTVEEIVAVMRAAARHGARSAPARPGRRALARRAACRRGSVARRGGCRSAPRLGACAPRQGRPPARGRHRRLGLGTVAAVARHRPRIAGHRHRVALAARHRHRRDHRSRPRPARAHDRGQHEPSAATALTSGARTTRHAPRPPRASRARRRRGSPIPTSERAPCGRPA
jgi:hypothetical protein